jgi:YidC/Oxa1 family membrane protein insertase
MGAKNVALAVLLSFGILLGWEMLVMRPQRRGVPPPPSTAAPVMRGPDAPVAATTAAPERKKVVEFEIGRHRISFNLFGAAVEQWSIQETAGHWIPLVLEGPFDIRPLATHADREFAVDRRGDEVVFRALNGDIAVEKTFRVSPDSYLHQVSLSLENRGRQDMVAAYALGWGPGIQSGDADPKEALSSQRAILFEPPRLFKVKSGPHEGPVRWWAADSRYFLAAFFNDSGQNVRIEVDKLDKLSVVKKTTSVTVPAGGRHQETLRFYLGPKGYAQLQHVGDSLERSVDFGMFGELGKVVLNVLYFFQRLTGNYGWGIILLTLLIQIITLPLTIKSFRHGARMKALQPQMKKLQELYKTDPKRLNAEMLNLYQKNGLKFMGMEGCFPILIQLPVFWALYTTLRNAYELRNAPWLGWVQDLSVHDPYYVLPVLMGLGMLAQQKLTMAAMDPAQARMMLLMPVIFTFFFLKLPSGLVLYWFTNSLLSIAIQLVLLKRSKAPA